MNLSVIIIHAAPEQKYRDVLLETIRSIRSQEYTGEIEVIVTDDGSCWSQMLLEKDTDLQVFDGEMVQTLPALTDLQVDAYLLARTSNRYLKAPLWNQAVAMARHDKLVFLDDDHPFTSKKALARYSELLDRYDFVFGRIIAPDRTYRRFRDPSVQGTNFAMRRGLFERIKGFGEYTTEWGCGEDSDLFWKVYKVLTQVSTGAKRAFFAGDIMTRDLCTGRWLGCHGGAEKCIAGFQTLHGVHPHTNPSRTKSIWVERSVADHWFDFYARINNYLIRHLKKI